MKKKVAIFDPYLDTLGGGERYMMTIAECLAGEYQIDVFWDEEGTKKGLEERLSLDLSKVQFVENIFSSSKSLWQKQQVSRQYDFIFYMSDGSIPFLFGKKNFLCFMVPFTKKNGRSFLNKIKLKKINEVIAISQFTKRFIDQEYGVKSKIIFPPVAVEKFKPGKKNNVILAVGRFSQSLHAKKQGVLIEAFAHLCQKGLRGWELVLIGGLKEEDRPYLEQLKKKAQGLPIKFLVNAPFAELKKNYGQAKIFWHTTGFGEDENLHPEKMEHFGIVVVEAMAAGCVPVVIGKGGIREIVVDGRDGFLWQTLPELEKRTLQLIKSPEKLKEMAVQSIKSKEKFSQRAFCQGIHELVKT